MDVKSTFLNGDLEEEVYIEHPEGFQLLENLEEVCRLKKEPRAWYSKLEKYLQQQGFKIGTIYNNLYIKYENNNLLIIVFYVDVIIFGSDADLLSQKFVVDMKNEYDISMLGEL